MIRLFVALVIVSALPWIAPSYAQRPNILLIVSDDHGLQLGCYGDKHVETPNLDALAQRGVRMSHAFCTTASCSPSRSVILTGLYSHATRQYGLQHAYHHFTTGDNIVSLPARLKRAGYRTTRVGKLHLAPDAVYPFDQVVEAEARDPVRMAGACEEVIASADRQPFFLYFCTEDPHRSPEFNTQSSVRPNLFGNTIPPAEGERVYSNEQSIPPAWLDDSPASREEWGQYLQSVTRVDRGVGKLMELLTKHNKADNTLVVYISDNGPPFSGAKTTLYEPGIRLPCLLSGPGIEAKGSECAAMITWADLTPTIIDLAGVPVRANQYHGRSFKAALNSTEESGWDSVFLAHNFHEVTMYYPMRAIRNRRYKLIENLAHPLTFPFSSDIWDSAVWRDVRSRETGRVGGKNPEAFLHRPQLELYDLENDPLETVNLAAVREHAQTLEELHAKLRAEQSRTQDPWVIKREHE